jgi:hypothetical protein
MRGTVEMKNAPACAGLATAFVAPAWAQAKADEKVRFEAGQTGSAVVVTAIEPAK